MLARLILILVLLLGPCANAQISLTGAGAGGSVISGGTTYIGPGDVVSGATAWYGLRGYNAAFATGSKAAINVRRASDNTTSDIDILTNGKLDVATFNTFVGSDGTASCTLAGTTGACTGASGTVHVNDTVTGTGLTQPCIVASASNTAPTIEIAGTTTSCGTVSVAETFTFQVAGFVPELYDQTASALHLLQATAGAQPQLLPQCLNSGTVPCVANLAGASVFMTSSGNLTPATGVMTIVTLADRVSGTTAVRWLVAAGAGSGNRFTGNNGGANEWTMTGGASGGIVATASDVTPHSGIAVMNGASSVVNIDGTETSGTATGSTTSNTIDFYTGAASIGYIGESGDWDNVAFTSGSASSQAGKVCGNLAAYYGTTIGTNC